MRNKIAALAKANGRSMNAGVRGVLPMPGRVILRVGTQFSRWLHWRCGRRPKKPLPFKGPEIPAPFHNALKSLNCANTLDRTSSILSARFERSGGRRRGPAAGRLIRHAPPEPDRLHFFIAAARQANMVESGPEPSAADRVVQSRLEIVRPPHVAGQER